MRLPRMCLAVLMASTCFAPLVTGGSGPDAPLEVLFVSAYEGWYDENKDYLFFSDSQGSRFLIDEQAKAKGIPTETLRGWSSEDIDYRPAR